MRWLLITVGGSPEPIIFSIREGHYDRVVFICSGDSPSGPGSVRMITGTGAASAREANEPVPPDAIPPRSGLHRSHWRLADLVSVDDIGSVYASVRAAINTIRWEDPNPEIDVDFTAGSKSLSGGLLLAAVEEGIPHGRLISPYRPDLKSVADGTQVAALVKLPAVGVTQAYAEADLLLSKSDYRGAGTILERILTTAPKHLKAELQKNIVMCRAFRAWDRFDYRQAADLLPTLRSSLKEHAAYAFQLANLEPTNPVSAMLLIVDELAAARRRAAMEAYCSAVTIAVEAFMMLTIVTAALRGVSGDLCPVDGEPPGSRPGPLLVWDRVLASDPKHIDASLFSTFRARATQELEQACKLVSMQEQQAEILWKEMDSIGLAYFVEQDLRLLTETHELLPYPEWPVSLIREADPARFRS